MGIVRHDPNAITVSVLGGFSEATRAAGFAGENGPIEDSVAVFLDRLLKVGARQGSNRARVYGEVWAVLNGITTEQE